MNSYENRFMGTQSDNRKKVYVEMFQTNYENK